jgi:hypothetical protein
MTSHPTRPLIWFIILVLLTGCGLFGGSQPASLPPGVPLDPDTTLAPAAELVLQVTAPANTPDNGKLAVQLLDPVTGLDYNTLSIPLEKQPDGLYQVSLTPPVGTLLYYRYILTSPEEAGEVTGRQVPVRFRTAYIPGPVTLRDVIAGWSGIGEELHPGRILGLVRNAANGDPLAEMVISAGGQATFSDGEGRFRIDGLPPGLGHITIFSPTGAYQPRQQGVLIAADASTPVELELEPAQPTQVTFQVTVPPDTPPEAVVRIAGNAAQLGNRFFDLPGGMQVSSSHMQEMVRVDQNHFLAILTLYEGMDVRYKYSLGDGFWNAERGESGAWVTRQAIIQLPDPILRDEVLSWKSETFDPIRFEVSSPPNTPDEGGLGIQFFAGQWLTPLPMWPLGADRFAFTLFSPRTLGTDLRYRYCRSLACGNADDSETVGPLAAGRPLDLASDEVLLEEQVERWQWFEGELDPTPVVAVPVNARAGYELGLELVPGFRLSWQRDLLPALDRISSLSANSVTFSPRWSMEMLNPYPAFGLDPTQAPFFREIVGWIDLAFRRGLQVNLRPALELAGMTEDAFWTDAARDPGWWRLWFEQYRSYLLSVAHLAAEKGVQRLIVDLHSVAPALPGGSLANGQPSAVPAEGEALWRQILADVRSIYSGRLVAELEVEQGLQTPPPFMDAFDEVRLYWHAPLASEAGLSFERLQQSARFELEAVLADPDLPGQPITLSVELLSIPGSALACAPAPDGSCRPASEFDQGAVVDPDLAVDMPAQAAALNALILAAMDQDRISGFSVRGYDPGPILHDKSASIAGKMAEDVIRYWYEHLLAR